MLQPACTLLLGMITTTLAKIEGNIAGGSFASIDHHAHSAFLNVHCVSDRGVRSSWICGSSIVTQNIFLTAGHCLYGCTYHSHMTLNLGNENRQKGQIHRTHSFIVHEGYNPKTSSNDICLLRTEHPVLFSRKATRVALMKRPPYFESATVAGWGMIDERTQIQSDLLKCVNQKVWIRKDCLHIVRFLPNGVICAASENPHDYAARGDSGSALIVRGYIQIGLVSYKIPSLANHLIMYSDVGHYYDWIRHYAPILSCVSSKNASLGLKTFISLKNTQVHL